MKILHKFLIRSYLLPLLGTFFIMIFVLLMHFLWLYVDDLVGKGLEWYIIFQLLYYASATFVPMALPLSILLSSLMLFGNLGEKYELVAMKASGISLQKAMRPMVFLSIVVSVIAFLFANNVMPVANLRFRSMLYDVKKKKLAFNIKEGEYYSGVDDYIIRVDKKGKDGNSLKGIMIYDHSERMGNRKITVADSGEMNLSRDEGSLFFHLYDGYSYDDSSEGKTYYKKPFMRTKFKEQIVRFDLSGFDLKRTDESLFKNNYQMLNVLQLSSGIDSLQQMIDEVKEKLAGQLYADILYYYSRQDTLNYDTIQSSLMLPDGHVLAQFNEEQQYSILSLALSAARRGKSRIESSPETRLDKLKVLYALEYYRKYSLSFTCIVLFFIGAPLGAIIRKGGFGLPMVISVLMFVAFHVVFMTLEKGAKAGSISPFWGMWLTPLIFLPIGIIFTFKATFDSPIFDLEVWRGALEKIRNRIIKKAV